MFGEEKIKIRMNKIINLRIKGCVYKKEKDRKMEQRFKQTEGQAEKQTNRHRLHGIEEEIEKKRQRRNWVGEGKMNND